MLGFFVAPRICIGPGAIEPLSSLGAERAFVVVDPRIAEHGWHQRIVEEIAKDGARVEEFHAVRQGPTLSSLAPGAQRAARFGPDWIVAVGGGSTIDTAKGIWLQYARPDLPWKQLTPLTELGLRTKARFVAVPTTSGSGSDVTWLAQFWDDEGEPVEIASRELVPDWSLLDPTLPAHMPRTVTADSAFDALAHAFEALASFWATPISDGLAREAIGALVHGLPAVLRDPEDLDLRGQLHAAATMAGLALSNAQSGLVHAIAHTLGPATGLPHGRLVGILLPHVLEFNFPAARDRYGTLAGVLGGGSVQNGTQLAERVRQLADTSEIPRTLVAAQVDWPALRGRIDSWLPRIQNSTAFRANPRIPSPEELRELLERVGGSAPSRT